MSVFVLGAGAWGTATANVLAAKNDNVTLYAREKEVVDSINKKKVNKIFLPKVKLSKNITATNHLNEFKDHRFIFCVSPAQYLRAQIEQMKKSGIGKEQVFVILSKGIENGTLKLMSEIFEEFLENDYAILTGPTFAQEVAEYQSSSISIACKHNEIGEEIREVLETDFFKTHINNDIIGSQICGAVKNVIAIACGIVKGLKQGENSKASIITRGLKEISVLNTALGGKAETLLEPCGVGDLVLTCNSEKSRNYSFGVKLGTGKETRETIKKKKHVVEGMATSDSLVQLMDKLGISLGLCRTVNHIINGNQKPEEILKLV